MKINLKLAAIIILIISGSLFAQRGISIEDRMKNLDEALDLTDKQFNKVENILEHQSKRFRKLRDESDGDRERMREQARELRRETDDKILDVLDKEQKKKYRKHQEERRKAREERSRN